MNKETKHNLYKEAEEEINSLLSNEKDMILKMASINSILKNKLDYYFWVGFYIVNNGQLVIGPYQGTLGCLYISYERGICGRAARLMETQIVDDVHKDSEHIACDSKSNSEIVVPVIDSQNKLIAVFDIDSTEFSSFDEIDRLYLEKILKKHFTESEISTTWKW
ncbi:MAG: diguanylate phosphodiesterase [Ignavibacteria bacterium GWF2_33_9]|nr:MAG: diguanylate phosphodiesterase [Ignavibacteria bacterium GWF2_33_9]